MMRLYEVDYILLSCFFCDCYSSLLFVFFFFLMIRRPPRSTLFPTRRSSDLLRRLVWAGAVLMNGNRLETQKFQSGTIEKRDRKSTRLNSSHSQISYAVFCLKKKKKQKGKEHKKYTTERWITQHIHSSQ